MDENSLRAYLHGSKRLELYFFIFIQILVNCIPMTVADPGFDLGKIEKISVLGIKKS